MLYINKKITKIMVLVTILGLSKAFSQEICIELFKSKSTVRFEKLEGGTVSSLYINRQLISKNQVIELNSKKFVVKEWYNTFNGPVIVVETKKKGKPKVLTSDDFKNDLVVVDYVRLEELMNYKNDRVINRYMRDFRANREEAEIVFKELMKWFFLLHRYESEGIYFKNDPKHFTLGMYDETQKIDDMWHTFILFTIDYTEFGWKFLGYYQHHQPFDQEAPMSKTEKNIDRQKMYQFIATTVGIGTLKSWFTDMNFRSLQVPIKEHFNIENAEGLNENTIP